MIHLLDSAFWPSEKQVDVTVFGSMCEAASEHLEQVIEVPAGVSD